MQVDSLIQPIKAMRLRYLPLLMVYFAYGCSIFSGIGESFFVKEQLNLSAESLIVIGVWLSLPWNIKMVFGQFVDSLPLFGSQRKAYIYLAAILMVCGSLLMAGLAGRWSFVVALAPDNTLFFVSSLLTVLGVVLQDVVADAMSVEVVEREGRPQEDIDKDLAMVQLLGRLSLSLGMFLVAGLGGWLAQVMSYQNLFLLTLVIPLISITGILCIRLDKVPRKPINKTVLIGGLIYAVFIIVIGLSNIPFAQEVVFIVSLVIIIYLLKSITKELPRDLLRAIFVAALMIFIFRASPTAGPGAQWFMIDVLGFDKAFFGTLSQIGAFMSIVGMWFFARLITEKSIAWVLLWLTVAGFLLELPLIALYYGLHEWTMVYFGFGARTIVLIDSAIASPFAQLAMIPMLALIARYAPKGNAATWFALMASFMNLALTAGSLFSKYLNQIFVVTREVVDHSNNTITTPANYSELGVLLITVSVIGLLAPLIGIIIYARFAQKSKSLKCAKKSK
ncbi:hypothetical protein [Cysteiniphilum sp. QT6929]|uniref:hypothetical protein n=1 Tax=Cysteiniphilum sp. QT6929 TaxID=2975055 RepID=UPI0024B349CF|nr:hypothetical protein [Cysteiniphilum sp. QT6929]WHN65639.1 hypothetical protein NYP54_00025 [Cysteiniphilum sp. QT6929]